MLFVTDFIVSINSEYILNIVIFIGSPNRSGLSQALVKLNETVVEKFPTLKVSALCILVIQSLLLLNFFYYYAKFELSAFVKQATAF